MSLTTFDRPLPGLGPRTVHLPRLLRWFRDDPRRTRIALTGAAVCTGVGVVIGAGLGWALTQAVHLAIGVVLSGAT